LVLVCAMRALLLTLLLICLPPVPPPSSGDWSGVVGEDCLSTWPRSGSCEFRSRLACRATQGTSKRWRIGVRLLLVPFLGEVYRPDT
jgi:hypothetical protein